MKPRPLLLWLLVVLTAAMLTACQDSPTVTISSPSAATTNPPTVKTINSPTINADTTARPTSSAATSSAPTTSSPDSTSGGVVPTVDNFNLTAIARGETFKVTQGTQGRLPNCTVGVVSVRDSNGLATTTIEVTTLGILQNLKENDTFMVGNVRYRIVSIFVPSSQSANNRGYINIKAEL